MSNTGNIQSVRQHFRPRRDFSQRRFVYKTHLRQIAIGMTPKMPRTSKARLSKNAASQNDNTPGVPEETIGKLFI